MCKLMCGNQGILRMPHENVMDNLEQRGVRVDDAPDLFEGDLSARRRTFDLHELKSTINKVDVNTTITAITEQDDEDNSETQQALTKPSTQNNNVLGRVKKSLSYGGYGILPGIYNEVSFAELKQLVSDGQQGKKEPTKTTKQKIKEFAAKYKDFKVSGSSNLPWYREIPQQSQLAHIIVLVSVLWLSFRLIPDSRRSPTESSTLTRLTYISTVSAVFGTECWMTFISGLALFFRVPRHTFSQVQAVLFPLYFLLKSVLLLLAFFAYTQHKPTYTWDTSNFIQGCSLAAGFLVNLAIRLYLSPPLITLMTIKMAIEKEEGLGGEVGSSSPGRLTHCPHYMKLYRAFRRIHTFIAVGNIVSMAATSLHLYTLAIQLCSVV